MSDILSYKVLTVDLWDGLLSQKVMARSGNQGYDKIPDFIKTVNNYLKNGYTLKGTTLNIASRDFISHRFSQAVVRYIDRPLITDYTIVIGTADVVSAKEDLALNDFETKIHHLLINGWHLFGELQSCFSDTNVPAQWGGRHQYSQVLVKYKKESFTKKILENFAS